MLDIAYKHNNKIQVLENKQMYYFFISVLSINASSKILIKLNDSTILTGRI